MKKIILLLIIMCLLLCACNDKKDAKDATKFPQNTNKVIEVTESPNNELKFSQREDKELKEYDDFGSYLFWSEQLKYNKKEIDNLIDWIKNINYCTSISFDFGSIRIEPDSISKKICKESKYNEMIKMIFQNEYTIINDWSKEKRIYILYRFDFEDLSGNYRLVYAGSKLNKSEKKYRNYKRICQDYYIDVIFYE